LYFADDVLNPVVVVRIQIRRDVFAAYGHGNLSAGANLRIAAAVDLFEGGNGLGIEPVVKRTISD
jgi:hypothetical protein